MTEPYGALTEADFDNMKVGETIYGVWRTDGGIKKIIHSEDHAHSVNISLSRASIWCKNKYPSYERRAFKNYFHAWAHSQKIKEVRRIEREEAEKIK
jgi:hypothetical protein